MASQSSFSVSAGIKYRLDINWGETILKQRKLFEYSGGKLGNLSMDIPIASQSLRNAFAKFFEDTLSELGRCVSDPLYHQKTLIFQLLKT
jgi:hypothetical protein